MWNVPQFVGLGLFISPKTAPELHSGTQRNKNTRIGIPTILNGPTEVHLYVQQLQVISATCQLVPLRTEGLCSVCLRGHSGSLAFIPEDTLGNVKAVNSLCLVPKSVFMFSPSILVGCLPLQKLSRLIKRHCFRGRPTPCLQDERMRVCGWRAYVGTMRKVLPGLLQNFWGSCEKWRKECRKEGLWKQKPGGEWLV